MPRSYVLFHRRRPPCAFANMVETVEVEENAASPCGEGAAVSAAVSAATYLHAAVAKALAEGIVATIKAKPEGAARHRSTGQRSWKGPASLVRCRALGDETARNPSCDGDGQAALQHLSLPFFSEAIRFPGIGSTTTKQQLCACCHDFFFCPQNPLYFFPAGFYDM